MNTPTTPTDTARLTLDAITHGVTQLRASLADAYDRAENALTEAGHSVAAAEQRAENFAARATAMERRATTQRKRAQGAEADAARFKADHLAACRTIADMHEAATGRTGMGPIRGVVEDVANVRARAERLAKSWRDAEADVTATQERLDAHRRSLAAIFALSAETPFEEIREYAARNLTRSGERLLAAKRNADRAEATLQRVRDAEGLADALAAVAEYDGLPPEAARASATIAAAAEQPAAIDAERERDHALRLAAAEQARAEAVRVAERATQTLLRIKHAPTAAEAWTAIGGHFHMTAADAGRGARRWRSTAEQAAEERAETAAVLGTRYMGAAERYQAAWQNARQRAQHATHREEMVRARAERYRQSRNRWTRQALDAADTIKRVRALLDTHLGPLATKAVRDALATPEPITCEVPWHVHQDTAPTTACRRSAPEEG